MSWNCSPAPRHWKPPAVTSSIWKLANPDFPTPAPIVRAAQAAIADGRVFYTPALGLPELRQAIADFYRQRYGVEIPARRIVVTAGASAALTLALACLAEPGRKWLLPDPGYPCNRHFVRAFEAFRPHCRSAPKAIFNRPRLI